MRSAQPVELLSILVVDDDSALIRTLADILRLHGYAPATAATAREGLALAATNPPGLAIIDLRLPDMDGMELAAKLHALSELTQVVVLTGNASVESAVAALRERSVDYLVKPVNVEHLLQVASLATERWQRRKAEARLRESDERFRRVVESDMLGIYFWNETGIYDANDAFLGMVGYSRADLEGGPVDESSLTPPEYAELDAGKRAEIEDHGIISPYEKAFYSRRGGTVPVLLGAATLGGERSGGVTFVLDITDRKLAEHGLEARAAQQAAVASLGQRALLSDDLATLFQDAAVLVAKTLELPLSSVFERRSNGVSLVLRAGVGWDESQFGQVVAAVGGPSMPRATPFHSHPALTEDDVAQSLVDAEVLRQHGVTSGVAVAIPGSASSFGVLAGHDRESRTFTKDDIHFLQAIAHVLGTTIDRKQTESAFRQAQRLEAVGRLAAGVSHDFNNILTAITGFAGMVRAELADDDPHATDLDEILNAANRAAGLTRQLLAFSRQQVLEPRVMALNDIVVQMEKMLHPLLGPKTKLEMHLDPNLGLVKADPGKIEQVILNLCVNARDAMPDGGTITIETTNTDLEQSQSRQRALDKPGPFVMLSVTDTGTGMDLETQARVFEPFFSTKAPDKGTGLGLATVYGIVKQSGGEIWLYSEPTFGTSFKIFLPRINAPGEPLSSDHPSVARRGGAETILVADDDSQNRRVAQRILENAGYTVLVAKDGVEAAEVSAKFTGRIHLVATDMLMPNVNGPQLVASLRAGRPDVRVIYLSGYGDDTVTQAGLLDAGEVFLQKPFTTDMLLQTVRETLDGLRESR